MLRNSMAQTALNGPGERIDALRDTMSELLTMDEPRTRIAAMMCGLDIYYDLGIAVTPAKRQVLARQQQ
jgi:hypothetical protein